MHRRKKTPNAILMAVAAIATALIVCGLLLFLIRLCIALISLAAQLCRENPLVALIIIFFVAITLSISGFVFLLIEVTRMTKEMKKIMEDRDKNEPKQ